MGINIRMMRGKKGFTFFLVAFAAILFFVLLGFIWWTQIGEAGSSEIVQSACGKNAQYCTTTPQLELLGFLKSPVDINGQKMNVADALTLLVIDPQRISKDSIGEETGRIFENECFYVISKNIDEVIKKEKISGPKDCDTLGSYSFVTADIYRENDLVVEVAVGSRTWELFKKVIILILINAIL